MGNFSSPYDNSSLGIEQEPISQKQRMDVNCVHLRCACTLSLYFYDHPKCHWPKCTPPNSLSISAPNFLYSHWPKCASPNSFTTQLLYIRINQFGDSSSALFTKNKTCLNVFVGPGDGGLYPQFNGQRYLKMSDTHICMSQHRQSWRKWKYQLNQWYASHLGFVLSSHRKKTVESRVGKKKHIWDIQLFKSLRVNQFLS